VQCPGGGDRLTAATNLRKDCKEAIAIRLQDLAAMLTDVKSGRGMNLFDQHGVFIGIEACR
jgi:hypothetical protein